MDNEQIQYYFFQKTSFDKILDEMKSLTEKLSLINECMTSLLKDVEMFEVKGSTDKENRRGLTLPVFPVCPSETTND